MNTQTSRAPGLTAVLTAHEGPEGKLLLVSLTADTVSATVAPAVEVALVVDRSGSMDGPKLENLKTALAAFLRSLRPEDRVAIVSYDDTVEVLTRLAAPSETLARIVEGIRSGGSTNLYGGWLAGAKLLKPGGRVVLLSDGQANVGRYTEAGDLSRHARRTYERYRITTSTIGIGEDYDEALMAGMARAGGGGHYFAHSAPAIGDALGRERFAVSAVALSHVSLRFRGETRALGHLWAGETKRTVLRVDDLGEAPATVRYTLTETGVTSTFALTMPKGFGHSDDATLELIVEEASHAEALAADVHDPRAASTARAAVRAALLRLLAHPLADGDLAVAVRRSLEGTLERLEGLERVYDAHEAALHRKRSYQVMHNLAERAQSYSAFGEDDQAVMGLALCALAAPDTEETDVALLGLLPKHRWADLMALPLELDEGVLIVALANPRDGFAIAEIERETRLKVRPHPVPIEEDRVRQDLEDRRHGEA